MKLDMTNEERELLIRGLQIRICLIETGDGSLRANDAINMGQPKKVKTISSEQRELVAKHEALISKLEKCA